MQQHQGQQSLDFTASLHQRVEQPRQPDRFAREVRPHQVFTRCRGVAFGEKTRGQHLSCDLFCRLSTADALTERAISACRCGHVKVPDTRGAVHGVCATARRDHDG